MDVHQADPRISSPDINADPHLGRLFPDCCDQGVAGTFDGIGSAPGREEKAVPLVISQFLPFVGNRALPVQDQDAGEGFLGNLSAQLLHHPSVQVQLIHRKIITVRRMGIAAVLSDNGNPVGNGKRLFDVQIPLFSVLSHPSVVIDPVGHVGILLDLRDQNVLSDGVDRAGFDEQHIPFLHRNRIQHFQERILPDPLRKFLLCDLPLESIVQKCVLSGIHHVPHLGLSVLAFIFQGITVVRMDLDGQVVPCIDEFCQDGEIPEPPAVRSQYLPSLSADIFRKRLPGICSISDNRRAVRMAGQLPRLRQHFPFIFFSIFLDQPAAAPEVILAARL